MSGEQAFLSFANYMKTALDGEITVMIERKDDTQAPPYLVIQSGPENIQNEWLVGKLCQGWLVVAESTTEPLPVTMGKAINQVAKAIRDHDLQEKKDYTVNPPVSTGYYRCKWEGMSGEKANVPGTSRRLITWLLTTTNNGIGAPS